MKVLVTGAQGQLGQDVCAELKRRGQEYIGWDKEECDITDLRAVQEGLRRERPEAVIHCAAYTAVDQAEEEAAACWAVNVDGTRNLAQGCREVGARLLYLSTDYVFSGEGETPYQPWDAVNPKSVYGRTKLGGELAVQTLLERYYIVRISWVFGLHGKNFVKTMLRLSESREEVQVVADQVGSPTYTADLAPLLCDMVQREEYGIYHASNEGECSWAEFAQEIFRQAGRRVQVRPIATGEYPAKAQRPLNSRMGKERLEEKGFCRLPAWQDALGRYLRESGEKE